MKATQVIEQSACRILDTQPDATVRTRLLRDVLRRPAQDEALLNARQDATKSQWVQELVQGQLTLSRPPRESVSVLDRWFTSMELLSCFPRRPSVAKDAVE